MKSTLGSFSRKYGKRFKEHQKAPSPIHDDTNITGHTTTIENISIMGKDYQNLIRHHEREHFIYKG